MKNINYLYIEQQEIFLKRILLIYYKRKAKKLAVECKTYVCNKDRKISIDNYNNF